MNPDTVNAEQLRLHYLRAMGISSYYPRVQLPGALPSPVLSWPQAPAASQPTAPEANKLAGELLAESPSNAMPPPVAVRREPVVVPEAVSRRSASATVSATDLQFQLLLLPVDADLALLCQIPALAKPLLQDRQMRLLHNLLRWLGRPLGGALQPRRFQWPLPGLQAPADRQGAAASLGHFVEQALVEQGFRHLVLLGGQLAAQLEGLAFVPSACRLTITPGLDEMLALPALKRDAWQALLPLHAELHARRG